MSEVNDRLPSAGVLESFLALRQLARNPRKYQRGNCLLPPSELPDTEVDFTRTGRVKSLWTSSRDEYSDDTGSEVSSLQQATTLVGLDYDADSLSSLTSLSSSEAEDAPPPPPGDPTRDPFVFWKSDEAKSISRGDYRVILDAIESCRHADTTRLLAPRSTARDLQAFIDAAAPYADEACLPSDVVVLGISYLCNSPSDTDWVCPICGLRLSSRANAITHLLCHSALHLHCGIVDSDVKPCLVALPPKTSDVGRHLIGSAHNLTVGDSALCVKRLQLEHGLATTTLALIAACGCTSTRRSSCMAFIQRRLHQAKSRR